MYRFSRTLQSLSKLIVALYDACYMFYSMSNNFCQLAFILNS